MASYQLVNKNRHLLVSLNYESHLKKSFHLFIHDAIDDVI